MIQPIQFPNQYDVIREESERFNKLSSDRKFEMMESLIQTGLGFIEISPVKEQAVALREKRELQWQLAQTKLINLMKR